MKLLPPKLLNEKIQEQKSSEVKAGLFLAKKIDALIENLAETQKIHDESIENMEKIYANLLGEQTTKLETLKKEIASLEVTREKLVKPLDNEWVKVKIESEKNSELSFSLINKDYELKALNKKLESKEIGLNKREEHVNDMADTVSQNLKISEIERQQANDLLLNAQENEKEIKESLEIRTKEVEKRETECAYRELDIENKIKNALEIEEANKKETRRIESKQRLLKIALDIQKNGTSNTTNK